jgi:hypothetical protein
MVRVAVEDGFVVVSRSRWDGNACKAWIESPDPAHLTKLRWRRDDLNAGTVSGTACQQQTALTGSGVLLQAVRPDDRAVILRIADGTETWVGKPEERILTSDGRYAVVGDGSPELRIVDLAWGAAADLEASCPEPPSERGRFNPTTYLVDGIVDLRCDEATELFDASGERVGPPLSRDDTLIAADDDAFLVQADDAVYLVPRPHDR